MLMSFTYWRIIKRRLEPFWMGQKQFLSTPYLLTTRTGSLLINTIQRTVSPTGYCTVGLQKKDFRIFRKYLGMSRSWFVFSSFSVQISSSSFSFALVQISAAWHGSKLLQVCWVGNKGEKS
jgi:hypothetical protein